MDSQVLSGEIGFTTVTLKKYSDALGIDTKWSRGRKTEFANIEALLIICVSELQKAGFSGPEACVVVSEAKPAFEYLFENDEHRLWLVVSPCEEHPGTLKVTGFPNAHQVENALLTEPAVRVISFHSIVQKAVDRLMTIWLSQREDLPSA